MNKISALLLGAMAACMVACDDFDLPNPPAQGFPEEPALNASTLKMTSAIGNAVIDLEAANAAARPVLLAVVDSIENLPAGYELAFTAQIAADESFGGFTEVATEVAGNQVSAGADALNGAFHTVLATQDPAPATLYVRYAAYAVNGTSQVRLGGPDVYYCQSSATFQPFNPAVVIEDAYYIVGTATGDAINASTAILMTNSGKSPYDDPNFSAVIEITADQAAAGYKWAIVPQSTLSAGQGTVYAPADDAASTALSGVFTAQSSLGEWAVISTDRKHLIQFSALPDADGNFHFSRMEAFDFLYTPGGANGWNAGGSQTLYTTDYTKFQGYVNVDGEFKFTSAPDWDHTNYGIGTEAGTLSTAGGNIKVETAGLYWAEANVVALTYKLNGPVTTYGVIGDATPGGWDASTALTPSEDMLIWTATIHFKGEGEFKFRANDGWDINLGGDLSDLTPGGANIATPGEGDYEVTLDLSAYPYAAMLVKK